MKRYGYIRVSTKEQNPERQVLAMRAQEIEQSNIFCDRMSGQDFSRPQYLKLINVLNKGDTLVIKSIDRLGRNYGEILEQWRYITKTVGAEIQVTDMPLLNMNTVQADLTGTCAIEQCPYYFCTCDALYSADVAWCREINTKPKERRIVCCCIRVCIVRFLLFIYRISFIGGICNIQADQAKRHIQVSIGEDRQPYCRIFVGKWSVRGLFPACCHGIFSERSRRASPVEIVDVAIRNIAYAHQYVSALLWRYAGIVGLHDRNDRYCMCNV